MDDHAELMCQELERRRLLASPVIDIGGPSIDAGFATAVDSAGNAIVAGIFSGKADFAPGKSRKMLVSVGDSDVFVAKYSPAGALIWAERFGGGSGEINDDALAYSQQTVADVINRLGPQPVDAGEYVNSIAIGPADSIYFTGSFQGTADFDPSTSRARNIRSKGRQDIYVVKLNSDGSLNWVSTMGGAFNDVGKSIALDSAGNAYVSGFFTRSADFNPGKRTFTVLARGRDDAFALKLDADAGKLVWVQRFGGDGIDLDQRDSAESIALDAGNNVYITGSFSDKVDFDPGPAQLKIKGIGKTDIFIIKLRADGAFLWVRTAGGKKFDGGQNIAVGPDGSIYISGTFSDLADLDPDPAHTHFAIAQNEGDFDGVDNQIFIEKLTPDGSLVWARQLHSSGFEWLGQMVVDGAGNIFTTGGFAGQVDFDPSKRKKVIVSTAGVEDFPENTSRDFSYNIFVLKLNSDGLYNVVQTFGSTSDDWGTGIALTPAANVVVTGRFKGTVDFVPGKVKRNVRSQGLEDAMVLYLSGDQLR